MQGEDMEEETPMPTKDDIYFELLQYCDINPDPKYTKQQSSK